MSPLLGWDMVDKLDSPTPTIDLRPNETKAAAEYSVLGIRNRQAVLHCYYSVNLEKVNLVLSIVNYILYLVAPEQLQEYRCK